VVVDPEGSCLVPSEMLDQQITHSDSASFLVGLAPFFPAFEPIFFNSVRRCIALLFP